MTCVLCTMWCAVALMCVHVSLAARVHLTTNYRDVRYYDEYPPYSPGVADEPSEFLQPPEVTWNETPDTKQNQLSYGSEDTRLQHLPNYRLGKRSRRNETSSGYKPTYSYSYYNFGEKTITELTYNTERSTTTSGNMVVNVTGIRCSRSVGVHMSAVVMTSHLVHTQPVLDTVTGQTSRGIGTECVLKKHNNTVTLTIDTYRLDTCGVDTCDDKWQPSLCVTLRFPVVSGLKLPEDYLLTIRCRLQQNMKTHSKHLRITPDRQLESRRLPLVLSGGEPSQLFSTITLLSKTPGGTEFSHHVSTDDVLTVGQMVQLVCEVQPGHGWMFSRVSDVKVHKVNIGQSHGHSTSDNETVTLVDENGCLNEQMTAVSPSPPLHDLHDLHDPLKTTLVLRAFLFHDMNSQDEMILSVKISGCVSKQDCEVKCGNQTGTRTRRQVDQTIQAWQSQIVLKVAKMQPNEMFSRFRRFVVTGCAVVVVSVVALAVVLMTATPRVTHSHVSLVYQ